jgi:hypothetical protein
MKCDEMENDSICYNWQKAEVFSTIVNKRAYHHCTVDALQLERVHANTTYTCCMRGGNFWAREEHVSSLPED